MNNEKEMLFYLKKYCQDLKYENSLKALSYAYDKHYGQFRKDGHPYIIHPLFVAIYGIMMGFDNDIQIAVSLLHDVPEDCNTDLDDLDVNPSIKKSANLLNWKTFKMQYASKEEALQQYYHVLSQDMDATFVKLRDRFHNLSTMVHAFSREKMLDYTKETKTYYDNLYQQASHFHEVKNNLALQHALWLLRNDIFTLVSTYEGILSPEINLKKQRIIA